MGRVPGHDLLVDLRRELHRYPELSGSEKVTSYMISEFLKNLEPDEIIHDLGGNGLAARFKGNEKGPRVIVRAELDALPIQENYDLEHRSENNGVSHKCGHDGHMAIVAGVAEKFSRSKPEKGELIVLFQPAEETGMGAYEVINDEKFTLIEPDYIIALHNLPRFKKGEIVLSNGVFSAASVGMIIELKGKTSHAAEPENGISPAPAVADILKELPLLAGKEDFKNFTLVTIIHAKIGEVAFGTSPGDAVVMATLRALDNDEMEKLITMAEALVRNKAIAGKLDISVKWTEKFPATVNDARLTGVIGEIATKEGYSSSYIESAFRWSEDFGWFTQKYPGVLFGLGAGIDSPELHSPGYDFPDEIIETGVNMLTTVCMELFKNK